MENYTIDEILSAVDEIQNKKKNKIKTKNPQPLIDKEDYSQVPIQTLKLIEEAEKK
tara:strand:+ start:37 stop:204 length:168 start_codon:yes stop_codon:yes gene_type:complete